MICLQLPPAPRSPHTFSPAVNSTSAATFSPRCSSSPTTCHRAPPKSGPQPPHLQCYFRIGNPIVPACSADQTPPRTSVDGVPGYPVPVPRLKCNDANATASSPLNSFCLLLIFRSACKASINHAGGQIGFPAASDNRIYRITAGHSRVLPPPARSPRQIARWLSRHPPRTFSRSRSSKPRPPRKRTSLPPAAASPPALPFPIRNPTAAAVPSAASNYFNAREL